MSPFSLDQLQVFAAVVDTGSFSAAARRMNRAQSAVTYAVQKLEEQVGGSLFDRAGYRPALSDTGRALLPRVRRILEEAAALDAQARSIAGGLEPELSIVVDSMFPMEMLTSALADFHARYPTVPPRLYVETLGAAVERIVGGSADLGVVTEFAASGPGLERDAVAEVDLVAVAAPDHPLAELKGELEPDDMRNHVQLVLTDRSSLTAGRDHGVYASTTWRIADLGAKHEMLRAGLGWGSLPGHMACDDVAEGRLVRLSPSRWDGGSGMPRLRMVVARRGDRALGPAGGWLWERLVETPARQGV